MIPANATTTNRAHKRHRGGRSKHMGEVRLMRHYGNKRGFNLKPGMFHGQDADGYWVSYGELELVKVKHIKRDGRGNPILDADGKPQTGFHYVARYAVWRQNEATNGEWVRIYEEASSELFAKLNGLFGSLLKEARALRKEAQGKVRPKKETYEPTKADKDESESQICPQLGMKTSNMRYNKKPLGKPPFRTQFSDGGRTEFDMEKNALDVSPIPVYRMPSDYENPQHPYSDYSYANHR